MKKVKVIKSFSPEEGITINEGAHGYLKTESTPTTWPIFETQETGNQWDIAIEDNELNEYFEEI